MKMSQKKQNQVSIKSSSPSSEKKRKSKNAKVLGEVDSHLPKKAKSQVTALVEHKMAVASKKLLPETLMLLTRFPSALHADMGATWFDGLRSEFYKPYFAKLNTFLATERATKTIFPLREDVWTWTTNFPLSETRVVILGQGRIEFD
jgi:hypothetical protein